MTEVLSAPRDGSPHFGGPLRRTSSHNILSLDIPSSYYQSSSKTALPYRHPQYEIPIPASAPSSPPPSPQFSHTSVSNTSYFSTPASSLSLDTKAEVDYDEDVSFPSYESGGCLNTCTRGEETPSLENSVAQEAGPDFPTEKVRQDRPLRKDPVGDDNSLEQEPTRHVDYLSHEWKLEEIWSSWRYVVARRRVYSNSVRLENAAWRTWAKSMNHLRTISPESLNWLKDCDVTWLYGPLQTNTKGPLTSSDTPPASRLSKTNSFLNKKPILKKKSASEAILQRSVSTHSLLQQAGAILKAQEMDPKKRPTLGRKSSDAYSPRRGGSPYFDTPVDVPATTALPSESSSGLVSPYERRHIHFDNEVKQMIAVEGKDDGEDDEEPPSRHYEEENDEEEEEEEVLTMKDIPSRAKVSNRSTPRGSFSKDGKTIAPLPSTTLNYRGDTPDPDKQAVRHDSSWIGASCLPTSSSQETLRPPQPSANFLLDDDVEADLGWQPSSSTPASAESSSDDSDPHMQDFHQPGPGMRRTESGMFVPYDDDEDEVAMNNTFLGRVVDSVNTARDIAHVIWNVGWRR